MSEEKERLLKLVAELIGQVEDAEEENPGVDYAAEYRKQTGKDLETGKYVVQ